MDRRFDTAASIEGASLPVFIGGEYRQARSPKSLESFDPSIGRTWYRAADGGEDDVDDAVRAATGARASRCRRHHRAVELTAPYDELRAGASRA